MQPGFVDWDRKYVIFDGRVSYMLKACLFLTGGSVPDWLNSSLKPQQCTQSLPEIWFNSNKGELMLTSISMVVSALRSHLYSNVVRENLFFLCFL